MPAAKNIASYGDVLYGRRRRVIVIPKSVGRSSSKGLPMNDHRLEDLELRRFLHYYCLRRVGNWSDAEDIVQITLLRLLRMRESIEIIEIRPFACAVAKYEILRHRHCRARRRECELEHEPGFADWRSNDVPMTDERESRIFAVGVALEQIKPKWRRQIKSLVRDVSVKRMALLDGVHLATAAERRKTALIHLRRKLLKAAQVVR